MEGTEGQDKSKIPLIVQETCMEKHDALQN